MNNGDQSITNDAPYTGLDMASFRRAYTHTHLTGGDHYSEIKADIAFQEFARIVKKELRKSCRRVKIAEYRKRHPPKNFLQRVFTPYGFLTGRCDFCGREEIRDARQWITRQEIKIAFDNGFNPLMTRTGQFQIKWYRIMSCGENELRIQRQDLPWPFSAATGESSGLNFLMAAMFAASDTALYSHYVPWNDAGRPSFPDVAKKNLVGRDAVACFDCSEVVRRAISSGVPSPLTPIGNQDATPEAAPAPNGGSGDSFSQPAAIDDAVKKNRTYKRGGANERYCSEACYSNGGRMIFAVSMGGQQGRTGRCITCGAVATTGEAMAVPQRGMVALYCRSCVDSKKAQAHIDSIKACAWCGTPVD